MAAYRIGHPLADAATLRKLLKCVAPNISRTAEPDTAPSPPHRGAASILVHSNNRELRDIQVRQHQALIAYPLNQFL